MDGIMMMESLSQVPWSVVGRTHGNTHSTLTGMLVNWWVGLSPKNNWALDGGVTLGRARKGKGSGGTAQCDALLCMRSEPVGVVKVEGSKHVAGVEKLENLLSDDREELQSLRFAFLVLHSYEASGRGEKRCIPSAAGPKVLERIAKVSKRFPDKPIVTIVVDRKYERIGEGVRAMNEHFWGTAESVQGILFLQGEEMMRRPYDMTVLELEPIL